MQFALNLVIFAFGFSLAAFIAVEPRKTRKNLATFISSLRYVVGGSRIVSESQDQKLSKNETHEHTAGADKLLTKEQVETQYDMDAWQRLAYEEFKTTILAKGSGLRTFPCVYATAGYTAGDHRYVFLESDDLSEPRNLRLIAPALREYLRISRSLGKNTSLVIMGAPTDEGKKTVEEYNQGFWEMLRGLRIADQKAWPESIPQSTDNEKWTFCFDGEPLFPVALTPAHERRWSRHAPVPIVALQPKWVLDKLLSTPERRKCATDKVRKLLVAYDQTDVSRDLTSYGDVGTSEVHQLCMNDQNETVHCPYTDFDKGGVTPPRRSSVDSAGS